VVDETSGKFLLVTDYEAPNYKLVLIDPQKPQKEHWETIIPESTDKLDYVSYVGGRLIASYLKDANTRVSVFDVKGKKLYDVQLPGIGTAWGFTSKREDNEVFYTFTSFMTPSTIYRYNIKENKSELFRKSNVKFNAEAYETRQVFYESKDKTRVPLFIVHKKGLPMNGQNPTMLYGYGGFNAPMRPGFRISIIPLLENGGVYAAACLRGGDEYGEKWHRAGMLEKKQNVFDDFIAAAEYLVRTGYTSPQKLAIMGASNGGLLVGAVMNQRPDLFKVAIPDVGVMDMLRFHKFTIGWAWVGEYGSSENPEQFKFLYKYSPLHNIKAGVEYPATLVATADHDDRVFPAHSFKYIAALQERYKGKNPVLIRIETQVGHGAGAATSKSIQLYTDIYSFMFYNMGIKPVF
jgi:prolyl oligopeptidase